MNFLWALIPTQRLSPRGLQPASHSPGREMVEGPGCTLNGEKIRARVRPGQAVTDVRGSAVQSLGGQVSPRAASLAVVSSQVSPSCKLLWGQQGTVEYRPRWVSRAQKVISLLWNRLAGGLAFPYLQFVRGTSQCPRACVVRRDWTLRKGCRREMPAQALVEGVLLQITLLNLQ